MSETKAFIGCTKCYRKKKDCKCNFGDFHRIYKRNFNYWKFELVKNSCGKEITTARQGKDDAIYCGDVLYLDVMLCKECGEKIDCLII